MKILYVDIALDGHHLSYINIMNTIQYPENEKVVRIWALPSYENIETGLENVYSFPYNLGLGFSLGVYRKWLKFIESVCKKENPDIIHFLYGDTFYKYFGLGLNKFSKYKTVATFHHIKLSKLRNISKRVIFRKITQGIVHSENMVKMLQSLAIGNVCAINYPSTLSPIVYSQSEARKLLKITSDSSVICAMGATTYGKGLDLLLQALNSVKSEFTLLIAGKVGDFDEKLIDQLSANYSKRVYKMLKILSDEEFVAAIASSDIMVLPYRKEHCAMSGPMAEGIRIGNIVVGPSHGSIGQAIIHNDLGYVFETENVEALTDTLDKALSEKFTYSDSYKKYQKSLSIRYFQDEQAKLYNTLLH